MFIPNLDISKDHLWDSNSKCPNCNLDLKKATASTEKLLINAFSTQKVTGIFFFKLIRVVIWEFLTLMGGDMTYM